MTNEHMDSENKNLNANESGHHSRAERLRSRRKLAAKIGAAALLSAGVVHGAWAMSDQIESTEHENMSNVYEQAGDVEAAELAHQDAQEQIDERGKHLGEMSVYMLKGAGLLYLGVKKRTSEVVIAADKPTEQPKD